MNIIEELHAATRRYRFDVSGLVTLAFPWKVGAYRNWTELWGWHREFFDGISREVFAKRFGAGRDGLVRRVEPVLRSISSGTGTGKSSLILPGILFWSLAVFPYLRGVAVSASRENLADKFFADCCSLIDTSPFLKRYFEYSADHTIWVKGARNTRAFIFRTASAVEALSGTHSLGGVTCVLFEEAGGITDASFLATDGARSDAQVIAVAVGQPTTPTATCTWFREVTFGRLASLWNARTVSLLDMPGADDALRKRKALEHGGEDTDDFKIFVQGLPGSAATNSFISRSAVDAAMDASWVDGNGVPLVDPKTPVVAGLDLARGGEIGGSDTCMAFRAGIDGRIKAVSIPGHELEPRERADWAINEMTRERQPYGKPVVCAYDATGLDGLFAEALRERGAHDLFRPINFGGKSPSDRAVNYRSSMWMELSKWLFSGGLLPRDEALARTITAAKATHDRHGKIAITPKNEIAAAAGSSRLDELDARLLSLHEPPVTPEAIQRRTRRPTRQAARARTWMGG